jgi:hypothetical protein
MDVAFGPQSELLVIDFTDSLGLVYHVSHEPPSHTICFESLAECVSHVIMSENPIADISMCVSDDGAIPTVDGFAADTAELSSFLGQFPSHYLVHDLRKLTVGSGFPYYTSREGDFVRYDNERLWVQHTPKGVLERLRWFWRTGSFGY